jgi:23S rRNA pseudouridine2605 synthase
VLELVPAEPRVFPVGRLDLDTEGLLLLTNDGELAQLLTHPSHGVEKEYLAEVEGVPGPAALRALRDGVELEDGMTYPARVRLVQKRRDRSALSIAIHEGRKRQVRRMCEAVGHPVLRLVRVRIGPLRDPDLAPGTYRALEAREVRSLYVAGLSSAAPGG